MVGVVFSGLPGASRDTADGAGVPLILARAGNAAAAGAQRSPFLTRVACPNSQGNRPMGWWMVDRGGRMAFALAPDHAAECQMTVAVAFAAAFTAAGGEVAGRDWPAFRKMQDLGALLAKAKAKAKA